MKGLLTMSKAERDRLRVIQAVQERRMSQAQAAQRLELSVRQVKRLCRGLREQGEAVVISKRRGRPSNRRIDEAERERVVGIVRQHYEDFGPTLACEYLAGHHGYGHSTETLRQWMMAAGIWQARRQRKKRVFQLRERRSREGELVQIDGSPHDWFEQRAARCCLVIFVDDATGRWVYGRFVAAETSRAYLQGLYSYLSRFGRPVAFYSDRHSIFTKHDPEDPVPTQFERALRTLDIAPILACSPQAKGRVERSFQTLQDRLVRGLRLAGACSIEQGNEVLPSFIERYNERFAKPAADARAAHRPVLHGVGELGWLCSEQYLRTLSRSLSCSFRGRLFLIDSGGEPAYHLRGARITVCDDGLTNEPVLLHQGKPLPYRVFDRSTPLPERVADEKTLDTAVDDALSSQQPKPPWKPPAAHPWRRSINAGATVARSGHRSATA